MKASGETEDTKTGWPTGVSVAPKDTPLGGRVNTNESVARTNTMARDFIVFFYVREEGRREGGVLFEKCTLHNLTQDDPWRVRCLKSVVGISRNVVHIWGRGVLCGVVKREEEWRKRYKREENAFFFIVK